MDHLLSKEKECISKKKVLDLEIFCLVLRDLFGYLRIDL